MQIDEEAARVDREAGENAQGTMQGKKKESEETKKETVEDKGEGGRERESVKRKE
jgi:hypothetical protein